MGTRTDRHDAIRRRPGDAGSSPLKLGDLLVRQGVLSARERDAVLLAQRERGRPFGALAEEMFGVTPEAVEAAWAEQYASLAVVVDPREAVIDPGVLAFIERRQAWQFRVLPLEQTDSGLTVCTTQQHLPRALKFTGWRLGHLCQFVLADARALGEALVRHYPMGGMGPDVVARTGLAMG